MRTCLNDLRYSLRLLRRSPGFTIAAISALALGIGTNTAIFSVVNAVLLKPIAAPDPDRIVVFGTTRAEGPPIGASPTRFNVWREQTSLFDDISAFRYGTMNLTGVDSPEQIQWAQVSANYFHLFGLFTARGRAFTAEEDRPGAGHFAVLSDSFWKRAFAGDHQLVGKTIPLSGSPYIVIGIMAPGVETESPRPIDVWTPFQIDPATTDQSHFFTVAGRVKPGVTPGMIKAQLQVAADGFRRKFPDVSTMLPGSEFVVEPMRDVFGRSIRSALWILGGAVSFVLLIACSNVANLLLVRATQRKREIAIRAAVGAGRGRIIRQLLTESVTLSVAGGVLGLILGVAGIRALLTLNPGDVPRVGEHGITADWRVLGFTMLLSLVTGVVFGLIPALQASRVHLSASLKDSSTRSGAGIRQNKTHSLLVVAEMALALMLLIGSGLLIRTFIAMRSVNLGFDPHNVLTLQLSLSGEQYQKTAGVAQLVRSSLERIAALPGVETAAAGCCMPLGSVPNAPFVIVGRPLKGTFHARGNIPTVSSGYFAVFKIPIVRGRAFNRGDGAGAPGVVMINRAMARRFWPDGESIGAQITIGTVTSPQQHPLEIVGVAADVHERTDRGNDNDTTPTIYTPVAQSSDGLTAYMVRSPMSWMVRTRVEPHSLMAALKTELLQASGGLPVVNIRSMDEILSRSTARQDFHMALMLIFGGLALLLAAIGIYGVIAYSMQQRTQEIGIRLALGAEPRDVRNMVVMQGMLPAIGGVVIGLAAAFGLTRLISSFLYGVEAKDPVVFVAVPIFLSTVALFAIWLPARRASRIDPIQALRSD
jgi:putative ABC transport system permease protein